MKVLEFNCILIYLDLEYWDFFGFNFIKELFFLLRGVDCKRKRIGDVGVVVFVEIFCLNFVFVCLNF